MHIGFTGTRNGCTAPQLRLLRSILAHLKEVGATDFHHGDCWGADAAAHRIATELKYKRHCHPPSKPDKRAFTENDVTYPQKDYLVRDLDIVRDSDMLIAAPKGHKEVVYSGTWATVRRGRKLNRFILFIFPDGSVTLEGAPPEIAESISEYVVGLVT